MNIPQRYSFEFFLTKCPKFFNILGCLWKTLFSSRLQTFSITLMSGEFGGQFSRISNPFSENQVFERIELCAEALSCCNFSPKNISGNTFLQNLQIFDRNHCSTDFLEIFLTIVGNKTPKHHFFSAKFCGFPINSSFPFPYWVNAGLILVC